MLREYNMVSYFTEQKGSDNQTNKQNLKSQFDMDPTGLSHI